MYSPSPLRDMAVQLSLGCQVRHSLSATRRESRYVLLTIMMASVLLDSSSPEWSSMTSFVNDSLPHPTITSIRHSSTASLNSPEDIREQFTTLWKLLLLLTKYVSLWCRNTSPDIVVFQSYRLLKKSSGQLYTWDLFLAEVRPRDLLVRLGTTTAKFRSGIPPNEELRKVAIARVFSHVLRMGSVVQSDFTTGEDAAALQQCFHSGWLHAEKLSDVHDNEEIVYVFASQLHRWFVEWELFYPVATTPLDSVFTSPFKSNSSILELALEVIAGFSPRLLAAEPRIGPGCLQRPRECAAPRSVSTIGVLWNNSTTVRIHYTRLP